MKNIKNFDEYQLINESASRSNEQDILDYADKYGNEALGYAICDLIENSAYMFPEDLAELIWEYGGNTGDEF